MPGPPRPQDPARAHFGARLRHWRRVRGLSQAALGRELRYDHTFLSKIESGSRRPTRELAERADRLLETDGELTALWARERRTAPAAPGPPTSMPGTDAAEAMDRLLQAYTRTMAEVGGRDLIVPLEHHARTIMRWWSGAPGATSTALLVLAAGFAEAAGWAWLDGENDRAAALSWCEAGYQWATLARDPQLSARLLVRQSIVHLSTGDPETAIALAGAASRVEGLGPRTRAWAVLAEARAHAAVADARACERSLAVAERLLAHHDPADEPWTAGITDSVFALNAGTCYRDLALRGGTAFAGRSVEHVSRSLDEVPAVSEHDRVLVTIRLAGALACADQPEDAAGVLSDLLSASAGLRGWPRIGTELRAVQVHLATRWPAVGAVRELSDQVRSASPR
ncbi:helix-turn-helix domain-containing protein [Actinokineospora sp. UTMC 2448]|uniref:helix-turn-helix domain-containing protein n=1 Tax=Actinokineospora sp. UTMC 2448 TaxID=2268449 RepID=UPI002164D3A9|nr:helix-turn-helix transcriptional regulator [Actinokineospora sp. UTMC 2448]UVS79524.1 hypothetical protein Actkin_03274 [Actinokineospora sp. UTMC 2448]